jgi:hypothetical protein
MSAVTDGSQLELTNTSDLTDPDVQQKLLRYASHFQNVRNKMSAGKGSFGPYKPDWNCVAQRNGMFVTAAQGIGVTTIPNLATFTSQLNQAIGRLSRTKLNNLKRADGKGDLQGYYAA